MLRRLDTGNDLFVLQAPLPVYLCGHGPYCRTIYAPYVLVRCIDLLDVRSQSCASYSQVVAYHIDDFVMLSCSLLSPLYHPVY